MNTDIFFVVENSERGQYRAGMDGLGIMTSDNVPKIDFSTDNSDPASSGAVFVGEKLAMSPTDIPSLLRTASAANIGREWA